MLGLVCCVLYGSFVCGMCCVRCTIRFPKPLLKWKVERLKQPMSYHSFICSSSSCYQSMQAPAAVVSGKPHHHKLLESYAIRFLSVLRLRVNERGMHTREQHAI